MSGLMMGANGKYQKYVYQFLSCLLMQINSSKKKTGVIAPKRFVQRVKKQNEYFRSYMHQVLDIHQPVT